MTNDSTATQPPDAIDRALIRNALDETLLVEAGAGSGKTTALVDRMLRLIAGDHATVDEIAAVTFTRKAAGELRQRFQERLEEAVADGSIDPGEPAPAEVIERLHTALGRIDRAFMGTIHAFCARLLRERPLDARLDPAFRELTAPEERTLARQFWDQHLERLAADAGEDSILARLDAVGVRPSQLYEQFTAMNEASDVAFPVADAALPSPEDRVRLRAAIDDIIDSAIPGIPAAKPDRGWDSVQRKVRQIRYLRSALDFDRPEDLFRALAILCSSKKARVVLKRWTFDSSEVKEVAAKVDELIEETEARPAPLGRRLLAAWYAHRYGPALELVQGASRAFAEHRRRTAQLTFHDLLGRATDLVRRSPGARRGLGLRWRRILVDEFQDTDPLQAELLFLLASEPSEDPPDAGWAEFVPRPGALFVVGDPKQSIYRFRRADISLYSRIRARFETFGRVVRLTANFRSTPSIEAIVQGVFAPAELGGEGRFPATATEQQAGFAPLLTQPRRSEVPSEGTFYYRIPRECGRAAQALEWEAEALATWVADRVAAGERAPEDFLILTRVRRGLSTFARALEARQLPVLVSGSGVGIEDELRELRLVLEALVDPGNRLATLAALEGLFFGLDPDTLLGHVEAGGGFDYRVTDHPPGPVTDALAVLERWWRQAAERPADEVVEDIVSSIGLLAFAASGELGGLRAGALAFTMELVRTTAVADDASLAGALEALALVLDDDDSDVESPLEPGRGGAVRLMNLHKAKGLEAPVVVLAGPRGETPMGRSMIVERDAHGVSQGYCVVQERSGAFQRRTIAAPLDWSTRDEREQSFGRAEEDRLLYVAVTRAEHELVVGSKAEGESRRGPWAALEDWLGEHGTELALEPGPHPERRALPDSAELLAVREEDAVRMRRRAGRAGWSFHTVTEQVGQDDPSEEPAEVEAGSTLLGWTQSPHSASGPGGFSWGNAVHITLEAAARGLDGEALSGIARMALLENDRPVHRGEPTELEALLVLVERLRGSDLWRRALAAETTLTEHAFVLEQDEGRFLEGVIDLAFREADGWVIVDYKTAADDRVFELRLPRYRRQVALYADAWTKITGEPVKEALVWRVG